MELFIAGSVGLVIGFAFAYFIFKRQNPQDTAVSLEKTIALMLPRITQAAGEQTAILAKEKLESASQNLKQDFAHKQNSIDETIKRLHEDLRLANEKLEKAERERVGTFRGLQEQISLQTKQTDSLIQATTRLQSVLSNNQQRGIFGEKVAKDLLAMAGFAQGVDYVEQESQSEGTRPDFTVFLPSGMKINVDAKFPYQNLLKLVESTDEAQRDQYREAFEQDIKAKIKQVTTRDYINPEENTVDFVILFVPNEKIFSYIYDEMNEVWQVGLEKKVIFAGPFSFTAILRLVRQAYDNFSIQKNLTSIIKNIKVFKKEFESFSQAFDKVGKSIDVLQKDYNAFSGTRTNQLTRIVDKIELAGEEDEPKPLLTDGIV